jgi:hypothetical protein
LGSLICQAAGSDHIPDGLSVIDVGGEVRKLLARIATESKEGDWSDAMKRMIGEARVELARRGVVDDLGQAIHWPTWNPRVCQALLDKLAQGGVDCPTLAGGLARLEPNDSEMHQAREALLGKLASADGETVARLAAAFARLSPTDDEKGQACHAVLEKLASASQDTGGYLLEALIHLDPDEDSKQRVRQVVLDTLTHGELWCGDLVRQQPFAN